MNHKGTTTLTGRISTLRRFDMSDDKAMFRNLYSDPEAMRFLPWDVHKSLGDTREHLAHYYNGYYILFNYSWAIVPNGSSEPIGFIDTELDEDIDAFKVDYGIGRAWWNSGYASDALFVVIRYLFEEVGANRDMGVKSPN